MSMLPRRDVLLSATALSNAALRIYGESLKGRWGFPECGLESLTNVDWDRSLRGVGTVAVGLIMVVPGDEFPLLSEGSAGTG